MPEGLNSGWERGGDEQIKKFIALFQTTFENFEVFADTKEEAQKIALERFALLLKERLHVYEAQAKTERCDICQYTYSPSEVTKTNGEQLCDSCYRDKYQHDDEDIRLEDIPF